MACHLHARTQGDFQLLMVRNQIGTLTPNPFFGHNLYYKYSNGSCKLNLNIYVSKDFQWYKEIFNPTNFDPWNYFVKIWNFVGIPIPKVGIHLGVCGLIPSHFFTLLGMYMWFMGCTFSLHLSMFLMFSHCCPTSFNGFCMLPFILNIFLMLFNTFNVFLALCDIHQLLLVIHIAWEK